MEKNLEKKSHIGAQPDHHISPIKNHQNQISPTSHLSAKVENPRSRKLQLEYRELLRKMKIQQQIDSKDHRVNSKLKKMKEKKEAKRRELNPCRTLDKIDPSVAEEERRLQFSQMQKGSKNTTLYESAKQMGRTQGLLHLQSSKQNMFKIYRKQRKPAGMSNLHLHKDNSKINETADTVDLLDFGIFSEHKNCSTFMKKLKNNTDKQFACGINLNCCEDLTRFELILLKELKNQGQQWLDY